MIQRIEHGLADKDGKLIKALEEGRQTKKGVKRFRKTAVLGEKRLAEVWKDIARCTLPSWLSPVPYRMGDAKCGKLTADQWRTAGTIHLVITLFRLWGHMSKDSREYKLLQNFIHLAMAVKIAMMWKMTNDK